MSKTRLVKIKGDWQEVLNDCRSTVGKDELQKEPSVKFKKTILLAEHSPIRDIKIKWIWDKVFSWCATHWSRHKWECFIETRRSDRTGVDRGNLSQNELVKFTGEANVQNLIDTWRKRLCFQASEETREHAEDFKMCIYECYDKYIADVLVPNCVYRGGCPEMQCCGYFQRLIKETSGKILTCDIQERYDLYNEIFYKGKIKSNDE